MSSCCVSGKGICRRKGWGGVWCRFVPNSVAAVVLCAVVGTRICVPLYAVDESAPHPDAPQPVSGPVSLAGDPMPDIARFFNIRDATRPSLSPAGDQVAFTTSITGHPQLWVVATGGGWPRQLTFGESVTFHRWSPTGEWIIYGADRSGDEREGYYLVSPDGKTERTLLPASGVFREFGGFTRDGATVAYSSTGRNGVDFDIFVIDIATGSEREVFRGRMGLYPVAWHPAGNAVILSEDRGEDANNIYLLDVSAGTVTTMFEPNVASSYKSFSWTPAGDAVFFVTNQDRNWSGIGRYDITTSEFRYFHQVDADIEQVALSASGEYIGWSAIENGYSRLHFRCLKTGEDIDPPSVPPGVYTFSWAADAPIVAVHVTGPRVPGDIWTWNIAERELSRSTRSTDAGIDLQRLSHPHSVNFEARDGIQLHGLLYLPTTTTSAEKPPVLISVHGGPTVQARPRYNPAFQYLVTRGIAVFDLNYRGSTGFGKAFARLNDRRLRHNEIGDIEDALSHLDSAGYVDGNRAAIMGNSYGGYLVMAALTHIPERFRGGISFVGVSNWITALEGASPQLKASDRLEYGDISDQDDVAYFRRISPLFHVDRLTTPIMLLHGANDTRNPVSESDQFVAALRERGREVPYLRFPDEGHGIRKRANRITAYRHIAAFLERRLQSPSPE